MAAKNFTVVIEGNDDTLPLVSDAAHKSVRQYINYLKSLIGGARIGAVSMTCRNSAVFATGTVTCASAAAADTVTINGVAITAVSGTPANDQFDVSGNDTADATSLAAAINNSTTSGIKDIVTATSSGAVVTVKARVPGYIGNAITLASSNGTRLAVSAARLANGTDSRFTFSF